MISGSTPRISATPRQPRRRPVRSAPPRLRPGRAAAAGTARCAARWPGSPGRWCPASRGRCGPAARRLRRWCRRRGPPEPRIPRRKARSPSAARAALPPRAPGRRTAGRGSGTTGRRAAPADRATRARAGRGDAAGTRSQNARSRQDLARSPAPVRSRNLAWSRLHRSAQSPSVSDRDVRRIAVPIPADTGKTRKARHDRGAKRGWWRYRPRTDTVTDVSDHPWLRDDLQGDVSEVGWWVLVAARAPRASILPSTR